MTMLALSTTAALWGCASADAGGAPQAQKKAEATVCSQERPIGSNIAVTKCRTAEQAEREREAAASTLSSPSRGTATPGTAKPGS